MTRRCRTTVHTHNQSTSFLVVAFPLQTPFHKPVYVLCSTLSNCRHWPTAVYGHNYPRSVTQWNLLNPRDPAFHCYRIWQAIGFQGFLCGLTTVVVLGSITRIAIRWSLSSIRFGVPAAILLIRDRSPLLPFFRFMHLCPWPLNGTKKGFKWDCGSVHCKHDRQPQKEDILSCCTSLVRLCQGT